MMADFVVSVQTQQKQFCFICMENEESFSLSEWLTQVHCVLKVVQACAQHETIITAYTETKPTP